MTLGNNTNAIFFYSFRFLDADASLNGIHGKWSVMVLMALGNNTNAIFFILLGSWVLPERFFKWDSR